MKKLISFLLKQIVDHPQEIKVTKVEKEGLLTLLLKVAPQDVGKVIGKKGKTIKALTSLVRIKAIKLGKKVALAVQENKE